MGKGRGLGGGEGGRGAGREEKDVGRVGKREGSREGKGEDVGRGWKGRAGEREGPVGPTCPTSKNPLKYALLSDTV